MIAKRAAYLREVRRIRADRLVFIDESWLTTVMHRSHAWVQRGEERIERRAMKWGKNLTLLGAIRLAGWVQTSTMFATTNSERFVKWLRRGLLPKLRVGDVLVMDNLAAHHDPRVRQSAAQHGVRVLYLPPYSPDLNPIESAWALQKQFVRARAPTDSTVLRRVAQRARRRVTPRHCRNWFQHAGYRIRNCDPWG